MAGTIDTTTASTSGVVLPLWKVPRSWLGFGLGSDASAAGGRACKLPFDVTGESGSDRQAPRFLRARVIALGRKSWFKPNLHVAPAIRPSGRGKRWKHQPQR